MNGDIQKECARLKQEIDRDGGPHNLSATQRAFFESVCLHDRSDLAELKGVVFADTADVDLTIGEESGTTFDDPDAGRPDDAGDTNTATSRPTHSK